MINMAFMPLYMWEKWDVTHVTNARTDSGKVEQYSVWAESATRKHYSPSEVWIGELCSTLSSQYELITASRASGRIEMWFADQNHLTTCTIRSKSLNQRPICLIIKQLVASVYKSQVINCEQTSVCSPNSCTGPQTIDPTRNFLITFLSWTLWQNETDLIIF